MARQVNIADKLRAPKATVSFIGLLDGRMTNVDSLQSSLPLTPLLVVLAGDQDNRWDQQTP